jgi:hypothetical protein
MADRSPTKTFGLRTPTDLYYKLVHDIGRLRSARASDDARYAAFDCAVDSWHLTEWVLHSVGDEDHRRLSKRRRQDRDAAYQFTVENAARLPALAFCRQIANSVKHVIVTRGDTMENVSTGSTVRFIPPLHLADTNDWSKSEAEPATYIKVDGQRYDVIELFEAMASQWRVFLTEEQLFTPRPDEAE